MKGGQVVFSFPSSPPVLCDAVQGKCFFPLPPSSLYPRSPSFFSSPPHRQLLSPFLSPSLSLQISSAQQLLLFLQLAAARLHLLHVSAWALSFPLPTHTPSPCALSLSLSLFQPVYIHPPPPPLPLYLVTMETLSPYRDQPVLTRSVSLCAARVERVQKWFNQHYMTYNEHIKNKKELGRYR